MAQSGQLRGRVTEAQLIGLLDQVCERLATAQEPSIHIRQADAAQGKSTTKKGTVVVSSWRFPAA